MSDEKVLTKEIAEQFVADEDSVEMEEFTAIEDDAAVILATHEGSPSRGSYLYLSGLTELSDAAAESLCKYEGFLSLSGLESLSDAVAESLSKYEGDLWLSGLTSLSDAAAESLCKYEGDLDLVSLEKLSDAAAGSLSKHKGNLTLGLTEFSESMANRMSQFNGTSLRLGNLRTFPPSLIDIFLSCPCPVVRLGPVNDIRHNLGNTTKEKLSTQSAICVVNDLLACGNLIALKWYLNGIEFTFAMWQRLFENDFKDTVNRLFKEQYEVLLNDGVETDDSTFFECGDGDEFCTNYEYDPAHPLLQILRISKMTTNQWDEYLIRFDEHKLKQAFGHLLEPNEIYLYFREENIPACREPVREDNEAISRFRELQSFVTEHSGGNSLSSHSSIPYHDMAGDAWFAGYLIPLSLFVDRLETHLPSWSEFLGFDPVTKITELTPSQARELMACEWPNDLDLAGITTLEADVASELANTKYNLYLCSLTTISTDTAAALAKSKCTYIFLWGLDNIDTDTANALSAYEGFIVVGADTAAVSDFANAGCNLFCINLIEDEADAHKFIKTTGKLLFFSCETPILEVLVGHAGTSLQIGNTEITEEQARILLNYKGELHLSSVNQLSDDVAAIIADFGLHLSFDVLETVSDSAIGYLAGHPSSLYLGANFPLTKARANILCEHQHELAFGHSSIPEEILVILAGHRGTELLLSELTDLSDTAAQHLTKHSKLTLTLDNLPASAAKILRDAGHGE
jgi:hypothetical protein